MSYSLSSFPFVPTIWSLFAFRIDLCWYFIYDLKFNYWTSLMKNSFSYPPKIYFYQYLLNTFIESLPLNMLWTQKIVGRKRIMLALCNKYTWLVIHFFNNKLWHYLVSWIQLWYQTQEQYSAFLEGSEQCHTLIRCLKIC